MDVDLERIKALVDLMNANNLLELELEEEGRKVRLRKAGEGVYREVSPVVTPATPLAVHAVAPVPAAPPGPPTVTGDGTVPQVTIKSPMVGTFYRAPSPDAEPYVSEGDRVQPDTTLCIIEAMKVMNEIKAEVEGVVRGVLVASGEAVEYGQNLFAIEPSG